MKATLVWLMLQVPVWYCLAFDFSDPTIPAGQSLLHESRAVGLLLWAIATGSFLCLWRSLGREPSPQHPQPCDKCGQVKPADQMCRTIEGVPPLCQSCYIGALYPIRKRTLTALAVACASLAASEAHAWEFVDSRGSNVTTRGRDAVIIIGQRECVPLQRMAPALAALKADYSVEVFVLLPCTAPAPAETRAWIAAVPGASNLCVCEVPLSDLALDLWSAVGYAQPAAFLFDRNGFVKSNWMHYQTRTALEPAIARATIRLRSVPHGVAWPVSPLAPRLESSGDLATWFPVPASLITQAAGDNRAFYTSAPRQFYRLAW